MIVLDTNVISELWKIEPNCNVLAWIDAQAVETLYLSAIAVGELRSLQRCPRASAIYQEQLEHKVLPTFAGRVVPFDLDASQTYADLMARARAGRGKAIEEDGYIAATAVAHGLMVATRDTSPFEAAELNTINPWEASP
ncbi:MAG: VapC toxin protein [uncultured Caballeronia sp.]|nr:MAG: VapC toxin protein [uncultured Caballeronia sp.]